MSTDEFKAKFGFGPGSIIEYGAFGGEYRTVRVETVDFDIKNGRPGFDGTLPNDGDGPDEGVWGYCDQVTYILERDPA